MGVDFGFVDIGVGVCKPRCWICSSNKLFRGELARMQYVRNFNILPRVPAPRALRKHGDDGEIIFLDRPQNTRAGETQLGNYARYNSSGCTRLQHGS